MSTVSITIPDALVPVFAPERGEVRYRCMYGGRGSGKSFTAAKMAAIWASMETLRVLCTREFQASIRESFHAELRNAINSEPWLAQDYDIGVEYIRHKKTGSEFFFRGLRNNIASIKSMAQIDLTIVEEAEDIPEDSWQALLATIFRTDKSELWAIWNPRVDGSPVDKRFRKNPPDNCVIAEVNWSDNPWFPPALEELRRHEQKTLEDSTYQNIWEGAYLTRTEAQVFSGRYRVEDFQPNPKWDGPYIGADWGFAKDPNAAILIWKHGSTLYFEKEYYSVGDEIDKIGGGILKAIPEAATHVVRGDSARPDIISYLRRPTNQSGGSGQIPRLEGAEKGKGSVLDGIEFMRSHELVVHPRCTNLLQELRNYSYKVDRLSGDVLPDVVDDWNHLVDSSRYALMPIMKNSSFDWGAL